MPSFAATRLVNPPGIEPVLSVDQVWNGLQKKAREPKRFVPAISECRIDKEEGNKVRPLALDDRFEPVFEPELAGLSPLPGSVLDRDFGIERASHMFIRRR